LILLRLSVPWRAGSSPPSPELLRPPRRFIAIASASCASGDNAPRLIAALSKRRTIDSIGSTSSSGNGVAASLSCSRSRKRRRRTLVHGVGVELPVGAVAGQHRVLQRLHHVRVVLVVFAAVDVAQQAALLGQRAVVPAERGDVPGIGLQSREAGTADPRRRAVEARATTSSPRPTISNNCAPR
jgi:hypothetical protein